MSDPTDGVLGERERRQRAQAAMASGQRPHVPPSMRIHALSAEQEAVARTKFAELQQMFSGEWNEVIHFLTYQKILEEGEDGDDLDVWKERFEELLDEEGRMQMRLHAQGPFIDQLNHMLRLCGLTQRSWHLLVNAVIYDSSDNYKKKVDKMVNACRYQGFDPAVLLKKIIKCWNDGKRAPTQEFKIMYEGPEGLEEWTYSNKAKLIHDITFLTSIFLNRGAVIEKILKKSANDFSMLLRMLVAKYQIRANETPARRVRAEALGPEVITQLPHRLSGDICNFIEKLVHPHNGRWNQDILHRNILAEEKILLELLRGTGTASAAL